MPELRDEIASGDRRRALEALRDELADAITHITGAMRDSAGLCRRCKGEVGMSGLASMVNQLRGVLDSLDAIPDTTTQSTQDELLAKRLKRGLVVGEVAEGDPFSGKSSPRRSGSRRPGGGRKPKAGA
ncbi:hypothetical protein GCM10012275_28370 [Longimycelium tulufanense]|uniref:Uncharacterized protein n=1 Tax=Longimycelium tulufanense TaxID=907463 RepID=A0A8J3C8P3_9PSEU|nr:hypothetical protein [Longimycelium tulufanense]GGM55596.1 hypothetical protein GCM10012275_28370 [Longimycelium tulufanense]